MSAGAAAALAAIAAWFTAQGLAPPERDPRLDDAAAVAARLAAQGARTGDDLRYALRAAGVVDAEVMAVQAGQELPRPGAGFAGMTHAGGSGDLLLLARRAVILDRPPPQQATGAVLPLTGRLAPGWSSIQAVFSGPDGRVKDAPVRRRAGRRFEAHVPLSAGPGRYRIELLTEGPTVAALFTVWAGAPAPAGPEIRMAPPMRDLADGLAQARAAAGAPPLRRSDALDAVALAHSADMAGRGYFGHRSPQGVGPTERVMKAGVRTRRVLENIASARSEARAHVQVLDSPGHLRNLVDPTVSHYGIGVHRKHGTVYVTWLFAELGPGARTSSGAGRARTSGPAPPTP